MLGKKKATGLDGSFVQCLGCKKTLFKREFEENLYVCPQCGHHHRLSWRQRVDMTFDEGSFTEMDSDLRSIDTLEFPEYREKLESAVAKTGMNDSVVAVSYTHLVFYAINRWPETVSPFFYFLSECTKWKPVRFTLVGIFLAMLALSLIHI